MSCCQKCNQPISCGCERPSAMAHVRSVELIMDNTTSEMHVSVNGMKSNKIPYNPGEIIESNELTFDIPITVNNQTSFIQVIPVDAELKYLFINGIKYDEGIDFQITGGGNRDILWISEQFPLEITDTLTIVVVIVNT